MYIFIEKQILVDIKKWEDIKSEESVSNYKLLPPNERQTSYTSNALPYIQESNIRP